MRRVVLWILALAWPVAAAARSTAGWSDDGFRFSDGDRAAEFERGLARIEGLACDGLVTPHPGASGLWERIAARDEGDAAALIDVDACRAHAATWRERLAVRLERERDGG